MPRAAGTKVQLLDGPSGRCTASCGFGKSCPRKSVPALCCVWGRSVHFNYLPSSENRSKANRSRHPKAMNLSGSGVQGRLCCKSLALPLAAREKQIVGSTYAACYMAAAPDIKIRCKVEVSTEGSAYEFGPPRRFAVEVILPSSLCWRSSSCDQPTSQSQPKAWFCLSLRRTLPGARHD